MFKTGPNQLLGTILISALTAAPLGIQTASADHAYSASKHMRGACAQHLSEHQGRKQRGAHGPRHMTGDSDEFVDGKVAFMKAELGVSETQETEWQAFEAVLRESMQYRAEAHDHKTERQNRELQPGDKLASRIGHLEDRLELMKKMHSALDQLIAVLTPAQVERFKQIRSLGAKQRFL